MHTTIELLDELKVKLEIESDYALSQVLGLTRQRISHYRHRKEFLGNDTAMKVAELLGRDAGYVLACVHAERAKQEDERLVWENLARRAVRAAVVAAVCIVPLGTPSPAEAASVQRVAQGVFPTLCIMLNRVRRRLRRFLPSPRQLHHVLTLNFAPNSPY